MTGDTYPT